VKLLLDTHVAVWWFNDPSRVRAEARRALENPANDVVLSAASVWEAGLKGAGGKLDVPVPLGESARRWGLLELEISWKHATLAAGLPRLHGDPFDRMLIAQALIDDLVLVTRDRAITQYDVATMPA
jgi:PIN domain nuclease of toxin-antitoxin system